MTSEERRYERKRRQNRRYYEKHKSDMLEACRRWKEKNKDKISEYWKSYYAENRDRIIARCREWKKEHRDRVNEQARRRREGVRKENAVPFSEVFKTRWRELWDKEPGAALGRLVILLKRAKKTARKRSDKGVITE